MRGVLRLGLILVCLTTAAHAAYQWPDNGAPPQPWRTADEACSLGQALPELARLRAANPSRQYALVWAFANEYTAGESQCRFVIEERRPVITTDLFYDVLHIRTGAPDACALAGYLDPETGQCGAPKGAFGPNCPAGANGTNPLHGASGNKYQREADFAGAGSFPLHVERHYNSRDFTPTALGSGWRHTYAGVLVISDDAGTLSRVRAMRADGRVLTYTWNGSAWASEADVLERLAQAGANWTLTLPDDSVETYGPDGVLVSVRDRAGLTHTLTYTTTQGASRLTRVTHTYGQQLNFGYDAQGRLATLGTPDGQAIAYAYDAAGKLATVTYPGALTRTYHYNEPAQTGGANLPNALTGLTDERGVRVSTWTYDATGRATGSHHAGGVDAYTLAYQSNGSTQITDPLGTVRSYSFAVQQQVARLAGLTAPCTSGCGDQAQSLTRDANGNVTARRDFNGHLTCYSYDLTRNLETRRVEGLTGAACPGTAVPGVTRTISTDWHASLRIPLRIAEPTRRISLTHDAEGNVLTRTEQATTDADGSQGFGATLTGPPRVWTHTWNADGQPLTVDGPRTDVSDVTTYAYYADTTTEHRRGDLQRITNALGQATQFTRYDGAGRLLQSTDPNGVTSSYAYDARGRLASVTVAGATTTLAYDAAGQLTRVTLADASFTAYAYDGAGRLAEVADAAGNRIVYTLDAAGNRTAETWRNPDNSVARSRTRQFDALGRLHKLIGAAGQITEYAYDAQGNPVTVTDPKAQPTGQTYDARDRLTQVADALSGLTALAYDRQDRVSAVTAPNGAATAYTWDGLGNLTQEQSPDRGTTAATFDAAGNLLTRTDARGVTVTTTYDALNRPLTETYSTGETVTTTYDSAPGCTLGIGRRCRVQDSAGQTTYAYDAHGRVTGETRTEAGLSLTVTSTYDGAGRVLATTLPSGESLSLTRDAAGRVSALASAHETLAHSLAYDAAGALTAQTLGNGVTDTATYDADGQRSAQTFSGGAGNTDSGGDDIPTLSEWGTPLLGGVLIVLLIRRRPGAALGVLLVGIVGTPPPAHADAAYGYDLNGNLRTRTTPAGASTYSYDALDRLTREQGPVITQSFGYDGAGNRSSDGTGAYVYAPSSNRQTGRPQGPVTLDAAGHTTAQAGYGYTWDGAGRLKTVSQSGQLRATYHYDARHRRTRKVTSAQAPQGAQTVLYAYDQADHLIAESDATGPIRSYVWRDDVPLAQIEHRPTRRVLYLETDHLGTPTAARNEQGTVVWRWDSDAFGATGPDEDPDGDGQPTTVNLRFAGQYHDQESGLHYNLARYYDPTTGRYLSPDPIGLAGGINTYAYVENNPLRYVDPTGELLFLPLIFAATGAIEQAPSGASALVAGAAIYNASQHLPDVTATDVTRPDSCDDECEKLYARIATRVNELKQRHSELIRNPRNLPPIGPMSVGGHQQQFRDKQENLRRLLKEANAKGCTNYQPDAWEWATKSTPSPGWGGPR